MVDFATVAPLQAFAGLQWGHIALRQALVASLEQTPHDLSSPVLGHTRVKFDLPGRDFTTIEAARPTSK
jgi:hypothetical protein